MLVPGGTREGVLCDCPSCRTRAQSASQDLGHCRSPTARPQPLPSLTACQGRGLFPSCLVPSAGAALSTRVALSFCQTEFLHLCVNCTHN